MQTDKPCSDNNDKFQVESMFDLSTMTVPKQLTERQTEKKIK